MYHSPFQIDTVSFIRGTALKIQYFSSFKRFEEHFLCWGVHTKFPTAPYKPNCVYDVSGDVSEWVHVSLSVEERPELDDCSRSITYPIHKFRVAWRKNTIKSLNQHFKLVPAPPVINCPKFSM